MAQLEQISQVSALRRKLYICAKKNPVDADTSDSTYFEPPGKIASKIASTGNLSCKLLRYTSKTAWRHGARFHVASIQSSTLQASCAFTQPFSPGMPRSCESSLPNPVPEIKHALFENNFLTTHPKTYVNAFKTGLASDI